MRDRQRSRQYKAGRNDGEKWVLEATPRQKLDIAVLDVSYGQTLNGLVKAGYAVPNSAVVDYSWGWLKCVRGRIASGRHRWERIARLRRQVGVSRDWILGRSDEWGDIATDLVGNSTRENWTAMDVLFEARITIVSRMAVVLRLEFLSKSQLRLFAADCALRALLRERSFKREPDPGSWKAVCVTRDYALGNTTKEAVLAALIEAQAVAERVPEPESERCAAARAAVAAVNGRPFAAAQMSAVAAENCFVWGSHAERKEQLKRLAALIRSGIGSEDL